MRARKFAIIAGYLLLATYVISLTPKADALIFDASTYYQYAKSMLDEGIISSFINSSSQFIDRGYPTILALGMRLFGDNIITLQLLNYFFWFLTFCVLYLSIKLINGNRHVALLALFSPLYLTFSSKIYSESYASLGTSLIIYGLSSNLLNKGRYSNLALLLGAIILFSTKSVFLLLSIPLIIVLMHKYRYLGVAMVMVSVLVLFPAIYSSKKGGRSIYNLAIQSSKIEQSTFVIMSCIPYGISYPLGQKLLPSYQGFCHQNNPNQGMPKSEINPYIVAAEKRANGYNLHDWIRTITNHPFRYLVVVIVSMFNILLFEGVYPSILLKFPIHFLIPLYLITKVCLSIYLWINVVKNLSSMSRQDKRIFYLLLMPLLYFVVVVGNFPVEQRYFYPLIPYMYYLASIVPHKLMLHIKR